MSGRPRPWRCAATWPTGSSSRAATPTSSGPWSRPAPQATVPRRWSRLTRLAVKLARSRALLLASPGPLVCSVVIPAYSETTRLLPRGTGEGEHPDGEDFVVQKSAQLEWLFAGTPGSYDVIVVDDMSKPEPQTSGEAVAAVIAAQGIAQMRVLFLTDGVRTEKSGDSLVAAALRHVEIPKNTRKAGAVYYGAAKAIEAHGTGDEHVVVITDCDLSVDLGQLGNLLAPIGVGGAVAAAGSTATAGVGARDRTRAQHPGQCGAVLP